MNTLSLTQTALLTLALTLSSVSFAESRSSERHEPLQRLTQQLNLTDEQRAAFQALRDEAEAERQARRTLRQDRIDAILTEEQRAQLSERRTQHQASHRHSGERKHRRSDRQQGCDMKVTEAADLDPNS